MSWLNAKDFLRKCRVWLKKIVCLLSPTLYSRYLFRRIMGKRLHLKHPQGMNEKLMWLKLHSYKDNPLVTQCSDKYLVRDYVEGCGCGHILNELYGVWKTPEEIDWDVLPDAFVMKCNHGCGYNLLCPDKSAFNKAEAAAQLEQWLREDFWLRYAELQYRSISKRILCEKYLGEAPIDYKIYCFNGRPRYILVCVGRDGGHPIHTAGQHDPLFYFFDIDWNLCPYTMDSLHLPPDFDMPRPENLEQLLDAAEKLCKPFPYVRVDLYDIQGQILFGELTFTPSAAMDVRRLPEVDRYFGSLIELPEG